MKILFKLSTAVLSICLLVMLSFSSISQTIDPGDGGDNGDGGNDEPEIETRYMATGEDGVIFCFCNTDGTKCKCKLSEPGGF